MKLLSALAVQAVVQPAAADFTRESGLQVEMTFGPVGALQAKLAGGETADLTILTAPVMTEMQLAGTIVGRTDLARTGIAVTVRAGAPAPDLSTPETFLAALLAARSIALTDPAVGGTAGIYLAGLLERLGVADAIKPKTVWQQNGFFVAQCVARGEADIGMTQISEIVAVPGAVVAGPLPPPLQTVTTYTAGVFAMSAERDAALDFIRFLTRPALFERWKACGFELAEGAESK